MKISELGEFNLIKRFSPLFTTSLPSSVILGIGDDCAAMRLDDETLQLVTTDLLVENVHFSLSTISPEQLGYKALAVNLSDIAAMGGLPETAFLSLALPQQTEVEWIDSFFKGFHSLAKEYNVHLLGGDISASPTSVFINICVLGRVNEKHMKTRKEGQKGDLICVTGYLGDSCAGLKLLQQPSLKSKLDHKTVEELLKAHLTPKPYVKEGAWLGQHPAVHAMIDLSDGIVSDLQHIVESSQVKINIDLDKLPLSSALREAGAVFNWNIGEIAAGGGEDYCLLFTVDSQKGATLKKAFEKKGGHPFWVIGEVMGKGNNIEYFNKGKLVQPPKLTFAHFHG